jgi:hypothetical protein
MMVTKLPQSPADVFIDQALVPDWEPSEVSGFDVSASPGDSDFLPVGQSLNDVGTIYPHLTVQFSTESSPGETTYNYINEDGTPGQDRNGELVITARAEDQRRYTGDSAAHPPVGADEIVEQLIAEVEAVALRNAVSTATDISPLGSQRGADQPNDYEVTPPVLMSSCVISYHYSRD